MARAYVGIGSNIEPEQNIRSAVRALRARYRALALSTVYQSPAEGFAGDDFYNLVAGFDTTESPQTIASTLADIEQRHGRVRYDNGMHSRTLDLDLLLYDDYIAQEPRLVLPRPDITQYTFVLRPLAELAPTVRHPELGKSLKEIWESFAGKHTPLTPVVLTPPL